jgi:hypothetical protein
LLTLLHPAQLLATEQPAQLFFYATHKKTKHSKNEGSIMKKSILKGCCKLRLVTKVETAASNHIQEVLSLCFLRCVLIEPWLDTVTIAK